MDVSKFLSPDQLQQFSLAARLANGEIPEKVSFAELAIMAHPEDIDARELFLQTLYAATLKELNDPARLQCGIKANAKSSAEGYPLLVPTLSANGKPAESVEAIESRGLALHLERLKHGTSSEDASSEKPSESEQPVYLRQAHITAE